MTSPSRLTSAWISNLRTEEERLNFETTLRNSTQVLGRLQTILQQRLSSLEEEELREDFYIPEVSHRQTLNAGKRHALKEVLTLLSFLP